jgi:hypothetical protein
MTEAGRSYRAIRRISDIDDHTLADVGETCERVPADVLADFAASGDIRLIADAPMEVAAPDGQPEVERHAEPELTEN